LILKGFWGVDEVWVRISLFRGLFLGFMGLGTLHIGCLDGLGWAY